MKEAKKKQILGFMKDLPIVSTEQISTFFLKNGSPGKRASEVLKELERAKLIEGRRREVGKSKVWRLSSNGRSLLNIEKRPTPLNTMKVDHILAVGDVWQQLAKTGLQYFKYEPRDVFGKRAYSPDAFFVFRGAAYLLEVQLTPINAKRWAEKWAVASQFFDDGFYKGASWQVAKGQILKPQLIVLSAQKPETVQGGSALTLRIGKDIIDLLT